MQRTAEAVCHGAITIVNALATGCGGALGVGLWTRARVTLDDQIKGIQGHIINDQDEDQRLMRATVRRVLRMFGVDGRLGARVETSSTIPIAAGLKSSSAASNAIALATLKALRKRLCGLGVVKLGVDASIQAGVTKTGAFDDATACYFGGLILTDNLRRRIVKRFIPGKGMRVLIQIPNEKAYTSDVDRRRLKRVAPLIETAFREAHGGNYWTAMTMNGLTYAKLLGRDTTPAKRALEEGAIAAGLSGKGPATAAIVDPSSFNKVREAWRSLPGRIMATSINYETATAVMVED